MGVSSQLISGQYNRWKQSNQSCSNVMLRWNCSYLSLYFEGSRIPCYRLKTNPVLHLISICWLCSIPFNSFYSHSKLSPSIEPSHSRLPSLNPLSFHQLSPRFRSQKDLSRHLTIPLFSSYLRRALDKACDWYFRWLEFSFFISSSQYSLDIR